MNDKSEKKLEKEKVDSKPEHLSVIETKEEIPKQSMLSRALDTVKTPKSLVKEDNMQALDIFTEELLSKAKSLVKSGLLPDSVDTPEKALVIMQKGKEFGFSAMTSFEHIVVISGKPSLDGAALGSLLLNNNIEYKVIKYCENVYEKDYKDDEVIYVKRKAGEEIKLIPATEEQIESNDPFLTKKVIDRITEIEFSRKSSITGNILTHRASFSYTDAVSAGLVDRDTYKKYFKNMLFWRALSKGANEFAPDVTLGMRMPDELGNGEVWLDETGKIIKEN